jgi:hypothetical protein
MPFLCRDDFRTFAMDSNNCFLAGLLDLEAIRGRPSGFIFLSSGCPGGHCQQSHGHQTGRKRFEQEFHGSKLGQIRLIWHGAAPESQWRSMQCIHIEKVAQYQILARLS